MFAVARWIPETEASLEMDMGRRALPFLRGTMAPESAENEKQKVRPHGSSRKWRLTWVDLAIRRTVTH